MSTTDPTVVLYTTTWCGDCRVVKRFLDEHGVSYREIDIEQDDDAAATVMRVNDGKRRVPTLEIGDAFYGNPPIPELSAALGLS
ncbi:MAG: glutaredoxin family protein [Acidobacteriota bacterium]